MSADSDEVVWVSPGRNVRFHRTTDCYSIRGVDVVPLPIEDIGTYKMCQRCWELPPELAVFHSLCRVCAQDRPKPCRHNGGVLVRVPVRGGVRGGEYDPSIETHQERYVWPENAWRYGLAEDPRVG